MMDDDPTQDDELIHLLDPHQASNTPNRPFQKGWLYCILLINSHALDSCHTQIVVAYCKVENQKFMLYAPF